MMQISFLLFAFLLIRSCEFTIANAEDNDETVPRIVGATKVTNRRDFAYQISLQVKAKQPAFQFPLLSSNKEWAHICGGSIIGEYYVLTAAHCVEGAKAERFSVLVGTLKASGEGGQRHEVDWIKIHPSYEQLVTSDIALMKMKKPFVFNDLINKIDLEQNEIGGGTPVILSGWGYTRPLTYGPLPNNLQMIKYSTITNEECKERGFNVTETEICTYKGVLRGACSGDSGGPLVNENRTKQIGIVSYGTAICSTGFPDAFTRVSKFIQWLSIEMN